MFIICVYGLALFSVHFLTLNLQRHYQALDGATTALLLSISVCYHARLQDRKEYEIGVCSTFSFPLSLHGGVEQFRSEIKWLDD